MAEMALEDIIKAVQSQMSPEYMDAISKNMEFKDRQLDQAWRIAQMGESGATSRARIGASASTANARTAAAASRANAKLAAETQRYGIDVGRLTDQEKIALERELGYGDLGIKSGQLGLGYLDTASRLRGPDDLLQFADFQRGASARQDVPIFMQSLLSGGVLPGFQAPGGQAPGLNIQGLMSKLAGGGTMPGAGAQEGQNATFLQSARDLATRGFHTLGPGSLESLRPVELGALKSAVEYSGDGGPSWRWDDLLDVYGRSGIGQGDPRAA